MTFHGGAEHPLGLLLYRGAEADLFHGTWEGLEAVFKVRKPLPYRLPELDEAIRRQRTIHEAEMMSSAKEAGVRVPHLYFVEPGTSTLVMEYVDGIRLKDALPKLSRTKLEDVFRLVGREVAVLHSSGIMHGDLTTANIIRKDGHLVFLDFGLAIHSHRTEDHAVDLRLIKETLVGAHSGESSLAVACLLEGYRSQVGSQRARQVLGQLSSIERRGRYARVT